ncbi:MAG: hypothetical protein Ta2D_11960 [Rickettsiales bacterium]|nr:MAG: hypothetical protein Ta2D_11960 [Rickettsiales bacterium]
MNERKNKISLLVGYSSIGLLVFVFIYFLIWRNITTRVQNMMVDIIGSNSQYEEISYSGFPFKKIVKIKGLLYSDKNATLTKDQTLTIEELVISSPIFSRDLDMEYKNIQVINATEKIIYSIEYIAKPTIKISLYSDYRLRGFIYDDEGFIIKNGDSILYTTGKMYADVSSIRKKEIIEYAIIAGFDDFKGTDDAISDINDVYKLKLDITFNNIVFENDSTKNEMTTLINSAEFFTNDKVKLSAIGEGRSGIIDTKAFGKVIVSFFDYKSSLIELEKGTLKTIKENDPKMLKKDRLTQEEQTGYSVITKSIVKNFIEIVEKNPSTIKDKTGIIVVERKPRDKKITLNGKEVEAFVNELMLLR